MRVTKACAKCVCMQMDMCRAGERARVDACMRVHVHLGVTFELKSKPLRKSNNFFKKKHTIS